MNYTVKFVVIIGIVGVVSFFTASLVIPEKNAVAPGKKSAQRTSAPAALRNGDIPIVVVDGKPADKPIMVSEALPVDHESLTPSVNAPADAKTSAPPVAVAMADTRTPAAGASASAPVNTPVNTKAPPADAKAAPADAQPATFSPKIDTADAVSTPFVASRAILTDARSVPFNTMAARLEAELAPPKTPPAPPPPAATPAALATASADTPPPEVPKKKPDPNAPLGYRLASTAVCAAVENRAPKGVADKFSKESGAVYYFTHIVGATSDSAAVMHRWYREGKLIQTSILEIKSPNWRTHSKRNLTTMDEPTGNWRVEVVDRRSGKVLESASFVVE